MKNGRVEEKRRENKRNMNSNFHGDLIAKNEKHDKKQKGIKSISLTGNEAIIVKRGMSPRGYPDKIRYR